MLQYSKYYSQIAKRRKLILLQPFVLLTVHVFQAEYLIFRLPPGCLQLHLHPNGYQIVLSEPKQQSALIPYSNREILSAIESGRMPAILSDWIVPEKIKILNQNLIKCAILEKNSAGQTLSTRLIDLKNNSHGYRVLFYFLVNCYSSI